MNRWLLSAIVCWALSLTLWVNYSWGSDPRLRNNCVSKAIINAEAWQAKTGQPAMIAVWHVSKGIDHVQAIGETPEGSYRFLDHNDFTVIPCSRHYDFEPYRYVKLSVFIEEQEKVYFSFPKK